MFFGQFLDDKAMSSYFSDNYKGVCIEVGAYDGKDCSNTLHFENKGWRALCIEPIPEIFEKCKQNRKECVNCCISDADKESQPFTVYYHDEKQLSAISSLKPDNRLIESHGDYITSSKTIDVKTRSLTSLLNELDYPKNIDFISIDTENTELNVLKGLDLNTYNVTFFIIENNYNDPYCEEYLKQFGYLKVLRFYVNDIFMKKPDLSIPQYANIDINKYFKITSAYYSDSNYSEEGNVTNVVLDLYRKFLYNCEYFPDNKNYHSVHSHNSVFPDKFPGKHKKLYINISNEDNSIYTKEIPEDTRFNWNELITYIQVKNNRTINNSISTSIGEIIDKYSILELKKQFITSEKKLLEINKELKSLLEYNWIIEKYSEFYKWLKYNNEQIWHDTDKVKTLTVDNKDYDNILLFAELSNKLLVNNSRRFRLKSYFNQLVNSNINEQKSYMDKGCYIQINSLNTIYDKISEINYLCIDNDLIYIDKMYEKVIKNIFLNPNIIFIEENVDFTVINLNEFSLDEKLKQIYDFEPIYYVSGGLLGDFIHQLSVINQKFLDTGRKGTLYISDRGDAFRYGLEKAYNDTFPLISKQNYIKDYKIFDNQHYDVDLVAWRYGGNLCITNWYNIFTRQYDVEWGINKWINVENDSKWNNKIIINTTIRRFPTQQYKIDFIKTLIESTTEKDKFVFVSFDDEDYEYFKEKISEIEFYKVNTIYEFAVIINSCEYLLACYSSPLSIALALHKDCVMIQSETIFSIVENRNNDMKHIFSHIKKII